MLTDFVFFLCKIHEKMKMTSQLSCDTTLSLDNKAMCEDTVGSELSVTFAGKPHHLPGTGPVRYSIAKYFPIVLRFSDFFAVQATLEISLPLPIPSPLQI